MQRKCLLISGGELNNPDYYKDKLIDFTYVIAADGGARHARRLGLIPDLVLGDFDTLTAEELADLQHNGVKTERYPVDKDYSDTHLGLLKAVELGCNDILIIAALGGRLDHTLANIMLLALPQADQARIRIMDENQEILLIRKEAVLEGEKGTKVSLLPLCEKVTGIFTSGLEYLVPQNTFIMGIPNGISNVMTGSKARIQIESGLLLAIIHRTERHTKSP